MKRLLLIAAMCLIASRDANADSSVTFYGGADGGVTHISNQGGVPQNIFQSGINNPNPWGFKGSEDLGDGLRAVFRLEGYYNLGTGASNGGGVFAHGSWVGLQSERLGSLTMGNQYDLMFLSLAVRRWGPMLVFVSPINAQAGPFAKLGLPTPFGMFDFDRIAGAIRVSNSVVYESPSFNGLTVSSMYGFGESASFSQNDTKSFAVDYARGDLAIDAAYTYQKFPTIGNGNKGLQNYGVGGRYKIGGNYVDVLYTNTKNTDNHATINVYEVGTVIPVAQLLNLHAEYQYMKGNAVLDGNAAQQVGTTLDYSFSKKTGAYVSAFYQRASGPNAQAYLIGMPGVSSTNTQSAWRVGMRTKW